MSFKLATELLAEVRKESVRAGLSLKFRNGLDYYILPLKRVTLNFCETLMCSHGLRQTICCEKFKKFILDNPSVEFVIEPTRGKTPVIRAAYINSGAPPIGQTRKERCVSVPNLQVSAIMRILNELRSDAGQLRLKFKPQVISDTPAIRSIWSPFHDNNSWNNPLLTLKEMVVKEQAKSADSRSRARSKLPIDPTLPEIKN